MKKFKGLKKTISLLCVSTLLAGVLMSCGGAATTVATTSAAAATAAAGETTAAPAAAGETTAAPAAEAETTAAQAATGEPILIGVSTAITGSSPLDGERTKQGVELAVKEINEKGGVLGRPLQLLIEDDQNLANISVNVANKLQSQDIVAQLGPQKSGNTKAIESISKKNGVPFLVGSTSPSLLDFNNEYFFRIRASDKLVAQTAAKFAVESLGAKNIGILYNNDDYGMGAKNVLEAYLQAQNIPFVAEGHNTGDKDMTGQIMKIKDANVDAIVLWTHAPESAIVARQLDELVPDIPVVASPTYTNQDFFNLVDAAAIEGDYSIADFSTDEDTPEMQDYVARFNAAYNVTPELFSTTYYQGIYILADAITRAGSTDREAVRKALSETTGFKGVMSNVDCNSKGEMIHEVTIVQLKDKVPVMKEKVTFDIEE